MRRAWHWSREWAPVAWLVLCAAWKLRPWPRDVIAWAYLACAMRHPSQRHPSAEDGWAWW